MVPPAVLLPWVVLPLLGVQGGSGSKQEGKGVGGACGSERVARGAGGRVGGGAALLVVLLPPIASQGNSEALPDPGPMRTALSELLSGTQSLLLSPELVHELRWVRCAHASWVPQLSDRHWLLTVV